MSANGDLLRSVATMLQNELMNPWQGNMQLDGMVAVKFLNACAAREDAYAAGVFVGTQPPALPTS